MKGPGLSMYIIVVLVYLVSCQSCGKNTECYITWEDMEVPIMKYHQLNFGNAMEPQDSLNVYIDVSFGLKVAFRDSFTKDFFLSFINCLDYKKTNAYKLCDNKIEAFSTESGRELYNRCEQISTFEKKFAPLDSALYRIVQNTNRTSVLITDGELAEQSNSNGKFKESGFTWAKEAFAGWLSKGNSIECFITDHKDVGKEKHLFYFVFIPRAQSRQPAYQTLIPSDTASRVGFYRFNNSTFTIHKEYDKVKSGVNENLSINYQEYVNTGVFEYHDYMMPWSSVCDYIIHTTDPVTNKEIVGGGHVLKGLFIKSQGNPLFKIKNIGLRVENVLPDYERFNCHMKCVECNPQMVTDANGRKQLSTKNTDLTLMCYDSLGNIKESYLYEPSDANPEVLDMFKLDNVLFMQGWNSSGSGEVGIQLHSSKEDCYFENQGEINFHRITVFIQDVEILSGDELKKHLEPFRWEARHGGINESLFKSMELALLDPSTNPSGQTIYTFYIKSIN